MIKKENFVSSVGANTKPGYVEQMIEQHNKRADAHDEKFKAVKNELLAHAGSGNLHLQDNERKKWNLAAEAVNKIPEEVKKDADRAETCAQNASVSELTANAAAAAAQLAKAHSVSYRDRTEQYAADSQASAGMAMSACYVAEQAYNNTLNITHQMSVEHNEMRTAFENLEDAYESFETKFDEKADKQTSGGGFVGGLGAVSADSSSAVGKGAQAKNGGFAGGSSAFANAGFAGGMSAKVHFYGGAAGRNAIAGAGFSGGDGAIAGKKANEADRVNCIQLGDGVNYVEKSLQVYEFQLMDGNGKIPEARIPELKNHFVLRGTVSDLAALPSSAAAGDVYIVESERRFSKPCARVTGGIELFEPNGAGSTDYQLSEGFVETYADYVEKELLMEPDDFCYQAHLYNPDGAYWGVMWRGAAVVKRLDGLNGYSARPGTVNSFEFYVCPEEGLTFYSGLYAYNGTGWDRISPEVFVTDLDKKADAANVYTKTDSDALISGKLAYQGEVNTFADLPSNAVEGNVYRLKTGCVFSNDLNSGLITGNFNNFFEDLYGDGASYNAYPLYTNADYTKYFVQDESTSYMITHIYDQYGTYIDSMVGDGASGWPKSMLAPLMTGEDTVAFYLSAVKTGFYTVGDLGCVYCQNGNWYPLSDAGWIKRELGDINTALDGILSIQAGLIGGGSV